MLDVLLVSRKLTQGPPDRDMLSILSYIQGDLEVRWYSMLKKNRKTIYESVTGQYVKDFRKDINNMSM